MAKATCAATWIAQYVHQRYWADESIAALLTLNIAEVASMSEGDLKSRGICNDSDIKCIISYQAEMPLFDMPFGMFITTNMFVLWIALFGMWCVAASMDYVVTLYSVGLLLGYQVMHTSLYPVIPIWKRGVCDVLFVSVFIFKYV